MDRSSIGCWQKKKITRKKVIEKQRIVDVYEELKLLWKCKKSRGGVKWGVRLGVRVDAYEELKLL